MTALIRQTRGLNVSMNDDLNPDDNNPPHVNGNIYHANAQNDELISVSAEGDGSPTTQKAQLPISEGELVIPLFHTVKQHGCSVDGRDSHITPYEVQDGTVIDSDDEEEEEEEVESRPGAGMYKRIWGGAEGDDDASEAGPSIPKVPRTNTKKTTGFGIRHVNCVGCNTETRVDAEEIGEYIRRHMNTCAEEDVYRRAAGEWKRIRDERRTSNSRILPKWSWKDIRSHFKYCCYDEQIDNLNDIRSVKQLITVTEGSMLRKNPDSGVVTVHPATFKQYKELMDMKLKLTANTKRKAPGVNK